MDVALGTNIGDRYSIITLLCKPFALGWLALANADWPSFPAVHPHRNPGQYRTEEGYPVRIAISDSYKFQGRLSEWLADPVIS